MGQKALKNEIFKAGVVQFSFFANRPAHGTAAKYFEHFIFKGTDDEKCMSKAIKSGRERN